MPNFLSKFFSKQKQPYYPQGFNIGGTIPPDFTTQDYLEAYSSIGWWHAVCFRIALGLSEVSWTLFDVSNREKPRQIYEHPILDLLHLVNPFQTSEEFIALDTIYMECLGESFWVLNYNGGGEPGEAVLVYPQLMSVVPAKQFPFVKGYVYGKEPNAIPLDINQVIHFKYPNPTNQFRGLGQAKAIGINLSAERNADKWVDQFFYNSARPDGVIQFDYSLSDEQFEKLKKQWSEKYKGVNKAHQVALLEGGGKYVQIQNSVKDMDFPNLKEKNRDIILGIEGMPLSVMGISRDVNRANAEAGDYTFARWVLKPRLNWKRAKLQEQLLPLFKNSKNLKLGFEEIVPETAEQKRLDAESGMRAGYLTVNEARIATGKDPIPNGDVLLIPLNLIPTPTSGKIEQPKTEEPEEDTEEMPKSKGGEGSGNFGHGGRPGEVGGSGDGGGGGSEESNYDNLYNEGGEGYNPQRSAREERERQEAAKQSQAGKRDSINRKLATTDWNDPANAEKIEKLKGDYKQTYIDEGWTSEVTATRRSDWNKAIKSGKYTNAQGKITGDSLAKLESDVGFTVGSLKEAVRMYGG